MSIEIVFYPKVATKDDLKRHLTDLGCLPCEHLWDFPKGSIHYYWFEDKDFLSFDGVEVTIFPKDVKSKVGLPGCDWALHTRTRASASIADRQFQNIVVKTARKKFGGTFVNDWHGKNRFIPLEMDSQDAVARGMYLLYERVTNKISAVRFSLPKACVPQLDDSKVAEFIKKIDPSRVLYNAIVPFAVAALEHFFKQTFRILLKYDDKAQGQIADDDQKVEMVDVVAISNGVLSIEDIIADRYSFQNIASIQKAFQKWFKIDFRGLIKKRKKIGQKLPILEKKLEQVINFRHQVTHEFVIDDGLSREELEEILQFVLVLIDSIVEEIEKRRGIQIRL